MKTKKVRWKKAKCWRERCHHRARWGSEFCSLRCGKLEKQRVSRIARSICEQYIPAMNWE